MNRMLVLLAPVWAALCLCACSPHDPIAGIHPPPLGTSAGKPAPAANIHASEVWPLGIAP